MAHFSLEIFPTLMEIVVAMYLTLLFNVFTCPDCNIPIEHQLVYFSLLNIKDRCSFLQQNIKIITIYLLKNLTKVAKSTHHVSLIVLIELSMPNQL